MTGFNRQEAMPKLFAGNRKALFAVLIFVGAAQAALAGTTALTVPQLIRAETNQHGLIAAGVLLLAALCLGGIRFLERVFAEKLGQDYVHEMRVGLVAPNLTGAGGPSVGITIARTTNDLSAVRNWIAWGIAPILAGVPLIVGVLAVLAVLHPAVALMVLGPIVALCIALSVLAGPAFAKARAVRKARGRLASQVSDTVAAGTLIRAGGGAERELNRIDKLSMRVGSAAVDRAKVAGYLRGLAASAAAISTLCVISAGTWVALDPATIASAITVVGVMATPIHDLGRVVEYRQSYLAARRILAPALAQGFPTTRRQRRTAPHDHAGNPVSATEIHVTELRIGSVSAPGLVAAPGARVVLRSLHPDRVGAVVGLLAGVDAEARAWVRVDGRDLSDLSPAQRRRLVGYAARGAAFERGTIARAVRYRHPESDVSVAPALRAVGLDERVEALPERERTKLRRGGEPLSLPERARLQLARAFYRLPPLLVFDHIDDQLGVDGRAVLRDLLADYTGIAILATDSADEIVPEHQIWDLDSAESDPNRVVLAGFQLS